MQNKLFNLVRRLPLVFVLVSLLLTTGCLAPVKPAPAPFASFAPEDQEVYLATFRGIFEKWRGRRSELPNWFFLGLNDYDAPMDLRRRLRAEGFLIEPESRFRLGAGVLCSLGTIEYTSASDAVVHGEEVYGNLGAERGDYMLRRIDGRWQLVRFKVTIRS